jgi:uncharacterized membrane protein YhaH (DUF805 family)
MNIPASKSRLQRVSRLLVLLVLVIIIIVIIIISLTVDLIIFRYIQPSRNNLYVSFMYVVFILFIFIVTILSFLCVVIRKHINQSLNIIIIIIIAIINVKLLFVSKDGLGFEMSNISCCDVIPRYCIC